MLSYKRYVRAFLLSLVGFLMLWGAAIVLIDPGDVLGMPVVKGVNQAKARYVYVTKPYLYLRERPEVVYLGTSRVFHAWKTDEMDYGAKEFNMSVSDMPLERVRDAVRFMCASPCPPKKIFVGLDYYQFTHEHDNRNKPGEYYDRHRLENLVGGLLFHSYQTFSDIKFYAGKLVPCVINSWKSRGKQLDNYDGYGKYPKISEKLILSNTIGYIGPNSRYKHKFSPDNIEYVRDIVNDAAACGAELYLFFNPISVELQAAIDFKGHTEDFQYVKREVAKLHPVYDFACVNDITTNLCEYYYEPSHYRPEAAVLLRCSMESGDLAGHGYLLTPETVEATLRKEGALYENWLSEHVEEVQILREHSESSVPLKWGELPVLDGLLK